MTGDAGVPLISSSESSSIAMKDVLDHSEQGPLGFISVRLIDTTK